jgi:acylphosphatase
MIARRFIVKGRVQGVGFRYFAIRAARHLRVVGTVRNMPDGSVEAIAEGTPEALSEFRTQLARGPSSARVMAVDETEYPLTGRYADFNVIY